MLNVVNWIYLNKILMFNTIDPMCGIANGMLS